MFVSLCLQPDGSRVYECIQMTKIGRNLLTDWSIGMFREPVARSVKPRATHRRPGIYAGLSLRA